MLTKEQQQFITEQYEKGIIGGFFYHHPNLSEDEYSGLASIGLCKCVPNYDETKGKFSTFAYKYMLNEILKYIQGLNTQKRKLDMPMESLDFEMKTDANRGSDGAKEHSETISNDINFENEIVSNICYNKVVSILNPKQKIILKMRLLGYSQKEIGEELNMTQQGINFLNRKIKSIIKQEYTSQSI